MQVRGNLPEAQIIVLVTVGAADLIEVLPFSLLWGERGR
jgi:hypothetical protein